MKNFVKFTILGNTNPILSTLTISKSRRNCLRIGGSSSHNYDEKLREEEIISKAEGDGFVRVSELFEIENLSAAIDAGASQKWLTLARLKVNHPI